MDPATLIGVGVALGAIFGASFMAGLNPVGIFLADIPSIIMVFGGSIGVTIANNTMPTTINALKAMVKAFTGGLGTDPSAIVGKIVEFADLHHTGQQDERDPRVGHRIEQIETATTGHHVVGDHRVDRGPVERRQCRRDRFRLVDVVSRTLHDVCEHHA